ncbi:hypothetical protein LAUMK4_02691 [Mycobacterium persicum]|uniref:Uncharacterized protein n=1 Tax=Mycobacterium persicum TaxID=1487726 RepID=A0AB38UTE9_9MYCO|nr:hypothetical protein LAUMK15_03016 [Mycobacterium persicum]VAZ83944.1 hypothetical protein LAUMK42_02763 [Mycobacterium persicum]VAZ94071.1 hypothetical protein LAUMK4_02691 [Mycobacterium persicum]
MTVAKVRAGGCAHGADRAMGLSEGFGEGFGEG